LRCDVTTESRPRAIYRRQFGGTRYVMYIIAQHAYIIVKRTLIVSSGVLVILRRRARSVVRRPFIYFGLSRRSGSPPSRTDRSWTWPHFSAIRNAILSSSLLLSNLVRARAQTASGTPRESPARARRMPLSNRSRKSWTGPAQWLDDHRRHASRTHASRRFLYAGGGQQALRCTSTVVVEIHAEKGDFTYTAIYVVLVFSTFFRFWTANNRIIFQPFGTVVFTSSGRFPAFPVHIVYDLLIICS